MEKLERNQEFAREAAILHFHFDVPRAVQAIQSLLQHTEKSETESIEKIQSLLKYMKSVEEIHHQVALRDCRSRSRPS